MNEYNYINDVQLPANEVKGERWRQDQGIYVKANESEAISCRVPTTQTYFVTVKYLYLYILGLYIYILH